jgi:hypothetical protein
VQEGERDQDRGSAIQEAGASERYDSWRQVGGYFDGDGNVGLEVVKYVLRFKLRFSDTWRPQIEAVRAFLDKQGIHTTSISHEPHREKKDAYRIDVGAIESVLKAARKMIPHCVKKAEDLRILADYLGGRITGNQAIERFNREVTAGRRSGYIREMNLPYTREEGLRVAKLENAKKARTAYAVNVSPAIQESIKSDHSKAGLGHIRLSKKYGYSVSVIRRVLGRR